MGTRTTQLPHPPRPKSWTKRDYNALIETGHLQKVLHGYLFRGQLIETCLPQHAYAVTVTNLTRALFKAFGTNEDYEIRIKLPFETPGESIPEPAAIVMPSGEIDRIPYPVHAQWIIEVSENSLEIDHEKAREFAAAQVPEYWIIDVVARRLEVYRQILLDPSALLGYRYESMALFHEEDPVRPLMQPNATFRICDLLPPH